MPRKKSVATGLWARIFLKKEYFVRANIFSLLAKSFENFKKMKKALDFHQELIKVFAICRSTGPC
jgi:hypothetical protein